MKVRFLFFVFVTFALAGVIRADEPAGIVLREFIYETAPFPQCHASTIVETSSGLVTAWFGGEHEKHPSVGIWVSRHEGGQWVTPTEVANGNQPDGSRLPCWNPVLFKPKDAPLMLFYKVGPSPSKWWGMLKTSTDGGRTWSDEKRLPSGILGPIKNKPVQLADGTILSPTSTETSEKKSKWRVHFEVSRDIGQTWSKVVPALASHESQELEAIQPSILTHADGKLQAIGRSRGGKVFETWSADQGKTWDALRYTSLPNPNSGTDAVTLRDGRHVIVYNHTTKGRSPLNVAISQDGREWQMALVLESEPGEFSYPAVIQARDGLIHITYTWNRKKVSHVVVNPKKLVAMPTGG